MSRTRSGTIGIGLAALALAAGCTRVANLSATEIVARNAAARGGLEAWRKVETVVWSGHVEGARSPVPNMPFELDQKRPNKTRLQFDALGSRSLRIFDGVRGFKVRPGQHGRPAVEPYTLEELRFAQESHGIEGPLLGHASRGDPVTLLSVDEIGGRKAYHLGVRLPKAIPEDIWVDAETYLEVRYDRVIEATSGAPHRVSVTYGDYRDVEGLKIPFLIATGNGPGEIPDKMQIERVALNPPLDDSVFANPLMAPQRNRLRAGGAQRMLRRPLAPSGAQAAASATAAVSTSMPQAEPESASP